MSFCKLPAGQAAALLFLKAVTSSAKTPQKVKDLVAQKDWHTLAVAVLLANPGKPVPSEADFAAAGGMAPGLQDAYFVLAIVDAKGTDAAKARLQSALGTHCWDGVAGALRDSMAATGVQMSGGDLKQAYAPGDAAPCVGPSDFNLALGKLVRSGQLVGHFFSQSLPDFFANDFANVFTGSIPGFFTGDFSHFVSGIGDQVKDGFQTVGEEMQKTAETVVEKINPGNW